MDPRIVRTRQSLRDALFSLARERSLDEISIGAIAEHAGVNRSTFYQHYSDKDTLLADALDSITEKVIGDARREVETLGPEDGYAILTTYVNHIADHDALYRRVLGDTGSATIQSHVRDHLERVLASTLVAPTGALNGMPLQIAAASIAGAAMGIIRAWLELAESAPPSDAADWIWQMLHQNGALDPQEECP